MLGPVIVFLIAYRLSSAVREFALMADLPLVTATQAWRFGGFAFLALYAYGVLPGYFAWPAGLGDMAIGAAAPWMLVGLVRDPGFAASRRFVFWNVLGSWISSSPSASAQSFRSSFPAWSVQPRRAP